MKRISIPLLLIVLSGCVTFEDAAESAFDAGRSDERAEKARENGDEALAGIYEQKARDDRRRADKSFIELLLGTIFEEAIHSINED